MNAITSEVCVVGGGPAGAAAALRMAMLGHSVVLIEKSAFPRPRIGESLTSSLLPLLDVIGIRTLIEREAFVRTRAALIHWAGDTQVREFSGSPGFHVHRSRFDQLLLDAAKRSGVRVLQPARVEQITTKTQQGLTLVVRSDHHEVAWIRCEFLVDATGRKSCLAGKIRRRGSRTLALYAYWNGVRLNGHETLVEAGEFGWFWGGALPGELFNAILFVDPLRYKTEVTKTGSVDCFYEQLITSARLLSICSSGKRLGPVQVCDATCLHHDTPFYGAIIKVGDAAFTIDPLASQGVQTAIGSAIHAAAVIHTFLERPSNTNIAKRFYVDRVRRSVEFHNRTSGVWYAEAAKKYKTEFWLRRSERVPDTFRVQHEAIDARPDTLVQASPYACFCQVPVVEGDFIEQATGVEIPDLDEPVVFVNNTKVAPLIKMMSGTISCADLVQLWSQNVNPADAIQIVRYLLQSNILKPSSACVN